jgi:transcriptional regulator with XRE-family HTH domain
LIFSGRYGRRAGRFGISPGSYQPVTFALATDRKVTGFFVQTSLFKNLSSKKYIKTEIISVSINIVYYYICQGQKPCFRKRGCILRAMARKTKKTDMATMVLPGQETLGRRIARLRKERGYTQVELAEKIGIIQVLISDYERDKLRPHPEVIVRFAHALNVTTDELLGLTVSPTAGTKPSLKTLRRLNRIENLPPSQQKALFKTIDNFLKGAEKE